MVSNAKNDLHQLISSLSRSEKRHFSLFTANLQKKNAQYMILYELLEKQDTFDSKILHKNLRKKLGKEAADMIRRLPNIQTYLYHLIMDSLNDYYSNKNSSFQVADLLKQVDILHMKGLLSQAKKKLRQAKKIATEQCLYPCLLQVLSWEFEMAMNEPNFKHAIKKVNIIQEEQIEIFEKLKRQVGYERVYADTFQFIYDRGGPTTDEERSLFRKASFIARDEEALKDPHLAKIYNYTQSAHAYFTGNTLESAEYAKARVDVFKDNRQRIINDTHTYIKALYNYIQTLISKKEPQYDLAMQYIEYTRQIRHIKGVHIDKRSEDLIFLLVYVHSARIYTDQGLFKEVTKLGDQLKAEQKNKKGTVYNFNQFFVYLKVSFVHFVMNNLDEALYWMGLVLHDNNNSIRYDVLSYARVLHIMIHYSLENFTILDHLLEQTQRYMQEHDCYHDIERSVLQILRRLNSGTLQHSKVVKQTQQSLEELKDHLVKKADQPNPYRQYWFVAWVESLLNGTSYEKTVQRLIQRKANPVSSNEM